MNPLDRLRFLTRLPDPRPLAVSSDIDAVIELLVRRVKAAGSREVPKDLQHAAVQRFWQSRRIESLKDGRLVSFGLRISATADGASIIDDRDRLRMLFAGVDRWLGEPRKYRRCYQGLVASYFAYDPEAGAASAKENWEMLREYLAERSTRILSRGTNPDWVTCVRESPHLFGASPCEPYGADLLRGDDAGMRHVRGQLLIDDSSWFVRDLILAQVRAATLQADQGFVSVVSRLVALLGSNRVLRDQGLTLLLDRYAQMQHPVRHEPLLDYAVRWWGNPWLAAHKMRWGSVSTAARQMVASWLKAEFVQAFFTLLAEEGTADKRRLEFWMQYVDVMDTVEFALGADARASRDKDFVALRRKMDGVSVELRDVNGSNNAFVMTIGDVVLVEFSGRANALYGYDRRGGLPFKTSAPVVSAKDGDNSLKSSRCQLWWKHSDGVHGWDRWEDMFAASLISSYQIKPKKQSARNVPVSAEARPDSQVARQRRGSAPRPTSLPFSRSGLEELAAEYGCEVEDNRDRGGHVWIRAANWNADLDAAIAPWGFTFRSGKGWWK